MEPALARFGFTELFVGVIVIALIGNAAEHYSAVTAACRDEMTLAVEIAVGSSAQIALLVAPALVLYSFAIGQPMSLLFNAIRDRGDRAVGAGDVIVVVRTARATGWKGCSCCRSISSSRWRFISSRLPAEVSAPMR